MRLCGGVDVSTQVFLNVFIQTTFLSDVQSSPDHPSLKATTHPTFHSTSNPIDETSLLQCDAFRHKHNFTNGLLVNVRHVYQ